MTSRQQWARVAITLAIATLLAPLAPPLAAAPSIEDSFAMLEWRNVGPRRGGRSIAATGHPARPNEYYLGAVGGGLWKTEDGGANWRQVTDGQIASSSVGAVAVAPGNPDIVYIGMGEGQLRANVMQGDGVYRSADGGKTWQHAGLAASRTITALRVHPRDPDIVYAAALGDPYAPGEERGVFKSRDGGRSWTRILFRSSRAGAIDLALDPANPDILYATLWQVYRKPWQLWSGGPESGIFKSTDGGASWMEITRNPGLPRGVLGKITIAPSPADPNRVWANIEAEDGGLYRSDDAGRTWTHVNGDRKLWQRSFYFLRVRPHPHDRDTVHVLSFQLERSTDAGKTFAVVRTRHSDVHDLWLDPANPARMIVADDGGASVSVNGGRSWTEQDFPTAQIYRLAVTRGFPYELCGAQQDNSTVCVPSRPAQRFGRVSHVDSFADFTTISGSESGHVAPHPAKPDVFFVGETNGLIRFDRARDQVRDVQPWPYSVMGQPASSMKERWNWSFPIVFAPQTPHALYAGSQHLWRSLDEGQSWQRISPDLTRADPATLGETGGPIRSDQDGPEVYGTIFTIAPSPVAAGMIWTGSDDGLVHLTRNDGRSWVNVTPTGLAPFTKISFIHASRHDPATAYLAANRYQMGDRQPMLWRTADHGRTWQRIDSGLPPEDFAHAIIEDSQRPGLLFAGTEHGVHISFDAGQHWHRLSRGLPDTHVSGLAVVVNELAIATHGRSFFVLEGLETLRHLAANGPPATSTLFPPAAAVLDVVPARLHLHLTRPVTAPRLTISDAAGTIVRRLALPAQLSAGAHVIGWDLRHDGATVFGNMILEAPSPAQGPLVRPGTYAVTLDLGGETLTASVPVSPDPRLEPLPAGAFAARETLSLALRNAVSLANQTVLDIRAEKARLLAQPGHGAAARARDALVQELAAVEATLYQVRNQSPKDKIAYPIQLNDRLAHLMAQVDEGHGAPTEAQQQVYDTLSDELDRALARYRAALRGRKPA